MMRRVVALSLALVVAANVPYAKKVACSGPNLGAFASSAGPRGR